MRLFELSAAVSDILWLV